MNKILHEIWIDAPIASVYELIGTVEGVSKWWDKQTEVHTEDGLVWEHSAGPEHGTVQLLVVDRVEDKLVRCRCISNHKSNVPGSAWTGTEINFELSSRDNSDVASQKWAESFPVKTVLQFSHSGWSDDSPYYAFCNFGWAEVLGNLIKAAEKNT